MGAFSVDYYGVSVSEIYERLPGDVQEAIDNAEGEGWGDCLYDGGGGYGQIAYIGVEMPWGLEGSDVPDMVRAGAREAYGKCPERVRQAVCAALGVDRLPEPICATEEGWE